MVAKVGRTTLLDGVHQLRVSLQVKLVSNIKTALAIFDHPENLYQGRHLSLLEAKNHAARGDGAKLFGEKANGRTHCFQASQTLRAL
jgi:hypothetical protein